MLFPGALSGSSGDVVTAVVIRDDAQWRISKWIDGPFDADCRAPTLDGLVATADSLVREGYRPTDRNTARVQYAIYPWRVRRRLITILDVTGRVGDLRAFDIIGQSLEIRGPTAEDLVVQASTLVPKKRRAMLRWIKQVGDPPGGR